MTALDPDNVLQFFGNHLPILVPISTLNGDFRFPHNNTQSPGNHHMPTMMSIPRSLRPASRRILSARPVVATAVPARWQHSNNGPFDPVPGHEMAVGELEGAKFRIEPLRRTGEDAETMRARLTCMCISSSPAHGFPQWEEGGDRLPLHINMSLCYSC